MKKKILFLQTNYPAFSEYFYQKNKNWQKLSYSALKKRWANECFGISNFYARHLRKHGWNADEVIANDWNLQSKWANKNGFRVTRSELPLTKHLPESLKNIFGLRGWVKKILFEQIRTFKPDVIYIYDLSLFSPNELRKIKRMSKLLVAQTATVLPPNQKVLKEFDLIISSFPHYIRKFRKMRISSEYLRWCIEKPIPRKIGKKKKVYNVSYVGAFTPAHSKGNKTMEELTKKINVNFWGYGEKYLLPTSPINKVFRGQAWGRKMYEIFAKSKIVVNRHINVAKQYANNMRMFEATGMGALLITDKKKNLSEFFEVGKEIVAYESAKDLIEKIKYYLKHPRERARIARAGQKRTLKDHTYEVRMKELDKILRKYLEK